MPSDAKMEDLRAIHNLYKIYDAHQSPQVVTIFPPQMSSKGRSLINDIAMLLEDPSVNDMAEKELMLAVAKIATIALSGGKSC